MPDIAMCSGVIEGAFEPDQICPQRHRCYRHVAHPTPRRQSYFSMPPFREDGRCDSFIPTETP